MRQYVATGDASAAIAAMRDWTQPQFERAAEAYFVVTEGRALAPMAVLQLELGLALIGDARMTASASVQTGERLLQRLMAPDSRAGAIDRVKFAGHWYAAAAAVFLLANDPDRVAPFVKRGLELSSDLPELRLMSGLLSELEAQSVSVAGPGADQRARSERTRLLQLAQAAYERLLKDQPSMVRARVRLGRVLWMLNDSTRAETELVRARGEAQDPAQQYLSAMFLARIYQDRGDLTSARMVYGRALAAAPQSQSAAAAIGFLDVMAGRSDRAQTQAHAVLLRQPAPDEWWAYKIGGYEWDAITWLREAVRP